MGKETGVKKAPFMELDFIHYTYQTNIAMSHLHY